MAQEFLSLLDVQAALTMTLSLSFEVSERNESCARAVPTLDAGAFLAFAVAQTRLKSKMELELECFFEIVGLRSRWLSRSLFGTEEEKDDGDDGDGDGANNANRFDNSDLCV